MSSSSSSSFLVHWLVLAVALAATTQVVHGVHVDSWPALFFAALVLGFVNAIVKPVLAILTLPITVLTLGLFYLVVNGLCFGIAAAVAPGFRVDSFGSAVLGALVLSVVSWLLGMLLRAR
jgi:putative membrane protein